MPHVPHVHRSSLRLLECFPSRIPSHHLRATTSLRLPPAAAFPAEPGVRCVELPDAEARGFLSADGGADLAGRWRLLASFIEQLTPCGRASKLSPSGHPGSVSARDVRVRVVSIDPTLACTHPQEQPQNRAAAESPIGMGSEQ